jgi:hypothetical protein
MEAGALLVEIAQPLDDQTAKHYPACENDASHTRRFVKIERIILRL